MSEKRLVLILGAGASKPYGFPTGRELLDLALTCEEDVLEHLNRIGIDNDQVSSFRDEMLKASPGSIDEFLEHRSEWTTVGKALIACLLMARESAARLYDRTASGQWYDYLFQSIRGTTPNDLRHNRVGIITFNYDRSLEHWWTNKLHSYYGKSPVEIAEMYQRIPIVHVHGQLGELTGPDDIARPYDNDITPTRLRTAMNGIHIVHEDMMDLSAFAKAHELLKNAARVVFLGFGYLPKNVERLELARHCVRRYSADHAEVMEARGVPSEAALYGTAQGFTMSEVMHRVQPLFDSVGRVHISLERLEDDVLGFLRSNNELLV